MGTVFKRCMPIVNLQLFANLLDVVKSNSVSTVQTEENNAVKSAISPALQVAFRENQWFFRSLQTSFPNLCYETLAAGCVSSVSGEKSPGGNLPSARRCSFVMSARQQLKATAGLPLSHTVCDSWTIKRHFSETVER